MTSRTAWWGTWKLPVVALVTIAVGVAEGYIARRQFDARQQDAFNSWRGQLAQVADQRARLIASWAAGVLADAQVIGSYPSVHDVLSASAPAQPTGSERAKLDDHLAILLGSFTRLQGYRAVCVADRLGHTVAASGDGIPDDLVASVREEVLWRRGQVIDFFLSGGQPVVAAGVPLPLGSQPGSEEGLLLLVADPAASVFAHLLPEPSWPEVAENLLVGDKGGREVLLSTPGVLLRPVPTHAFAPRRPLSAIANGGATELDDRGVLVIAAARPVSGTPWAVVSKIDRAAVVDAFRRGAVTGLVQWATYMVALLAIVFALLRHRQAIHASEQVKAAQQIAFLNRLLLTLSEANELMVREKDRQHLLDETCRIIVNHAGFRMAWVGELEPPAHVKPVAWAGAVKGYLDAIDIRYDDSPRGRGPAGTAIRERRTVTVDDIADEASMVPWRAGALERGYASVAAIPLNVGDRVLGALLVYSSKSGVLRGDALSLLERLANDMAFALDVMESQARHRETEQVLSEREEQLRQAQKMEAIGRLAGGVAHDFNNLLMAISGYAELALSARTEESRRERIEEIAIAAERAAALTRQLLAFSRKQVLQPRVFNLNTVVAEIEKMLVRLIGENVELLTRLAPALDNVRVDPSQMEQVLLNLAVNARDAMPEGGRLLIETSNAEVRTGDGTTSGELEPGRYVVLTVSDTGHGMAPDVLEHIFEPFFTTKDSGKGTGLGLSMVYGIVKQSGGAITVESAEGEGCTFRVYVPVASHAEEAAEVAAISPVPRMAGGRLLVVEDNAAVRSFVVESLRGAGYDVFDAESAEAALELLAGDGDGLDLLLTDVILPKMDGHELARRATEARPALKVLYMSGYVDSPKLRELALTEGIELIEKPFTSAAVAARVASLLEQRLPEQA